MKIYCSGIGGIGLSAYAALQACDGHTVLGSDKVDSALLDDLRSQGIEIFLNQDGSHIPKDCDLFVYSEAIPEHAPERLRAEELQIRSLSYPQALGEISTHSFVIAVCGTHGKSSTTAMAAKVLMDAGRDPTIVVGTKLPELKGRNWRKGGGNIFLLEACEYRESFLSLRPDCIVMTNTDGDHFDAFDSLQEYQQAFVQFIQKLPEDGMVITHGNDPACERIAVVSGRRMIDADMFPLPSLSVPGKHMRQNAQLVSALADHLDLSPQNTATSLKNFSGTWRRMEVRGDLPNGVTVIDDYAHHPTEIAATIAAAREAYDDRRLVCVFQPHLHDRTLYFYEQFTRAFSKCDLLVISNVYEARPDIEKEKVDIHQFVSDCAINSGIEVFYAETIENTAALLQEKILQPDDVLLSMGAGDISRLPDMLFAS